MLFHLFKQSRRRVNTISGDGAYNASQCCESFKVNEWFYAFYQEDE
ncbi:hypothetical protein [Candidatus Enterovibrio altilux]|uniref:Uncharacterized protein n=1 Tax=Candidatus Enterovibrio altilux TaxID=1927128 RepID=A0A291BBW1_9GAMM|nr:hypothetical protein [Candidatus Enterovibrio luxaltus]ATF10508.1 hypothetical protein BTN50_2100 [Candidatus Enterovibrio luxaltus]